MNAPIIAISDAMRQLGIRKIGFIPGYWAHPADTFSVELLDGWLATHIGLGATVGEALEDAQAKVAQIKAAA